MAKIVTGNTDILREYYELRAGTYDVTSAVYQLLEDHWFRDSMERIVVITSDSSEVFYKSGAILKLTGENLDDTNPELWRVSKLSALLNSNGETIIFSGNISITSKYKMAVGSIASQVIILDPVGGLQILNEDSMPLSAELLGEIQIKRDGVPYASISYIEKSSTWDTGMKLRAIGRTDESNQKGSSGKTQSLDVIIFEKDGQEIFRIEDFGYVYSQFTDAILEAGPDTFVEHFLSGDDQIEGTAGADRIYAGAGDDTVDSGAGDDLLIGGNGLGNDLYIGGAGIDTIKYSSAASGIRVSLEEGNASSIFENLAAIGFDKLSGIENIIGGKFNDTLIGDKNKNLIDAGAGNDILFGGVGNDTLIGGEGNDILDGGDGLDFAVFDAPASAINKTSDGWLVNGDSLLNIERLEFSDTVVALDITGNAGIVAKLLGATFGKESISNKALVGVALSYLDAGLGYPALMELAINAKLGATANNADIVEMIYTNVVGAPPSGNDLAFFTDWLDKGIYTKASFGVLAADTELNIVNVGLVGLASTGLEYTPYVA
jgi:Ca2+-binding RTX toxin-like protein